MIRDKRDAKRNSLASMYYSPGKKKEKGGRRSNSIETISSEAAAIAKAAAMLPSQSIAETSVGSEDKEALSKTTKANVASTEPVAAVAAVAAVAVVAVVVAAEVTESS